MKYLVANWKMNLTLKEAFSLATKIIHFLKKEDPSCFFKCMIAPPFPFLHPLYTLILQEKSSLSLIAQDVSANTKGAYTGEVSAQQLKDVGVQGVLIGHSERRTYHHEDASLLIQKEKICLSNDLIPILCLGEKWETREASKTLLFIREQLEEMCFPLQELISLNRGSSLPPFFIAYEPLWAIGTGHTPSPEEIEEVHQALRTLLEHLFPMHFIPLLYGGSVTPENSRYILKLPSVDGALVGGASLSLESFEALLHSFKSLS